MMEEPIRIIKQRVGLYVIKTTDLNSQVFFCSVCCLSWWKCVAQSPYNHSRDFRSHHVRANKGHKCDIEHLQYSTHRERIVAFMSSSLYLTTLPRGRPIPNTGADGSSDTRATAFTACCLRPGHCLRKRQWWSCCSCQDIR